MKFNALIAVEGVPTGDGRLLENNSITFDDPPYPLRFAFNGSHDAFVVGTVLDVWRSNNEIYASGELHIDIQNTDVKQAVQRVIELSKAGLAGLLIGVDSEQVEIRVKQSVLDAYYVELPPTEEEDGITVFARWKNDDEIRAVLSARLREVTVTDQPAITGTYLELFNDALVAASGCQPCDVFTDPKFGPDGSKDPRLVWQKPMRPEETGGWGCPFTIEDDGRVYGHLAINSRCHGAYASCVTAPTSDGDFSAFLTGEAIRGIPTGPIILDTTHSVDGQGKLKSYDHLANTGQAVADVIVGLDRHGTWVAGRLRPGITNKQRSALKGSALSGEWLPYGPKLRLAGILAVNSPGYLIQRKSSVPQYTLVAARTPVEQDNVHELEERLVASLLKGV